MSREIRNIFISHKHEDDDGLDALKSLVAGYGLTCRDASITELKANAAHNQDYIKYQILAHRYPGPARSLYTSLLKLRISNG